MKQIGLETVRLEDCVSEAQRERIVITRKGKPVILIVGVKGMDIEQLQLGSSGEFWKFITKRRDQKTISREELEKRMSAL